MIVATEALSHLRLLTCQVNRAIFAAQKFVLDTTTVDVLTGIFGCIFAVFVLLFESTSVQMAVK